MSEQRQSVTSRNADVTSRDVTELLRRMDMWDALFKGAMRNLDGLEARITALECQREEDEAQARIVEGPAPEMNGPQKQGPMSNAERQRAYRERKKQQVTNL